MIQFTLKCDNDHQFDSWFQSASAFDKLKSANMVACTQCGSVHVEKALMTPRVQDSRRKAKTPPPDPEAPTPSPPAQPPSLSTPSGPTEEALAALRKTVEENSEYVGGNFVQEARDIHEGIAPERAIYGEARPEDAKQLLDDGVPVAPLPFVSGRKTN